MAVHPLVLQLRFARSEFVRCLEGLSEEDGIKRLMPVNSISWMVGHMTNQEQSYWLMLAGKTILVPGLRDLVGTGKPASTPSLAEMWSAWREVTRAADATLDALTVASMQEFYTFRERRMDESIGTLLQRNIYHYWFHTGEAHAVRQMLGHTNLPQFVGEMNEAPYLPEQGDA
jgi:uncharacterized damage-inducible protein DinB